METDFLGAEEVAQPAAAFDAGDFMTPAGSSSEPAQPATNGLHHESANGSGAALDEMAFAAPVEASSVYMDAFFGDDQAMLAAPAAPAEPEQEVRPQPRPGDGRDGACRTGVRALPPCGRTARKQCGRAPRQWRVLHGTRTPRHARCQQRARGRLRGGVHARCTCTRAHARTKTQHACTHARTRAPHTHACPAQDPRVAWRKKNQKELAVKDQEEMAARKAAAERAAEHLKRVQEVRGVGAGAGAGAGGRCWRGEARCCSGGRRSS